MRTCIAAAAALLILGLPVDAGARGPGLYGGFSGGAGRIELDCDGCDRFALELSGDLGYAFGERALVAPHVVVDGQSTLRSGAPHVLTYTVAVGLRLMPAAPFWVDGAIGVGGITRGTTTIDTADQQAFAVLLRAGVEIVRREKWALDVRADLGASFFDRTAIVWTVGVGVTFFSLAGKDYSAPTPSPNVPPPPKLSN